MKAKSCLGCNIKKVPCHIEKPRTITKCWVQKGKASLVKIAEEEEEISEAALGQYDLSRPDPPSYHQQLLDDLVGVGAGVRVVQKHLLGMKEDQWKLGVQQVK